MENTLPPRPQLRDLQILFQPIHIAFLSPQTHTLALSLQKSIQIIGRISNILPMSRLKVNFNPKSTPPIKFRTIHLQESHYELALFRVEEGREIFLQRKTVNLVPFLSKYLDKLLQLHKQVERQLKAKEEASIAEIWRALRQNFAEKHFTAEVKYPQLGTSLNFKCSIRHKYDQIVEKAERAQKLSQMMREQAKQLFWQSTSLPAELMDKVLEQLGLYSEQVIEDPNNSDLEKPLNSKDNLKKFIKHFDQKYKDQKLPQLTEHLACQQKGKDSKRELVSATTVGGPPIKSTDTEEVSLEPFIGSLRAIMSVGKSNSSVSSKIAKRVNEQPERSVKIRQRAHHKEGSFSGIGYFLILGVASWWVYLLMLPLSKI